MLNSQNPNHLFGPVPSRRLGVSLGIDITPTKTCTYDCVYCEVCPTDHKTIQRTAWYSPETIVQQIKQRIDRGEKFDHITISGSGEPTLNSNLGAIIEGIKKLTDTPVAVITNSSLLHLPDVRKDLALADVLLPTIAGPDEKVFNALHNPHQDLDHQKIIDSLIDLKTWFKGSVHLEIMLLAGINDDEQNLEKLALMAKKIDPEVVEINTLARPAAYAEKAHTASRGAMEKLAAMVGPKAMVVASFKSGTQAKTKLTKQALKRTLATRPLTIKDLLEIFDTASLNLEKLTQRLVDEKQLEEVQIQGSVYLRLRRDR